MFVLASVVTLGVFGFAVMVHPHGHRSSSCPAATAHGTPCPEASDAAEYAAFHLRLLREIDLAASLAVGLLWLAILSAFAWVRGRASIRDQTPLSARSIVAATRDAALLRHRHLRRWLVFHEKRDIHPLRWVLGATR